MRVNLSPKLSLGLKWVFYKIKKSASYACVYQNKSSSRPPKKQKKTKKMARPVDQVNPWPLGLGRYCSAVKHVYPLTNLKKKARVPTTKENKKASVPSDPKKEKKHVYRDHILTIVCASMFLENLIFIS